jgi:glycosyltransferase involved in cell wall biosynthesis
LVVKKNNARLIIIGEGSEEENLKELVKELSLVDKVRISGYNDNPYPYYNKSRVFVLSSYSEGLPTVLIESLACGCPIISTDCKSGPREILEDGRFGKLVQVGNYHELSEAIISSITMERESRRLKKRALEFTIGKSTDEYLRAIRL